jgi:hypothetical protein
MEKSKGSKEKSESKNKTKEVQETVNHGSVFEALYSDFITLENLKAYLLKKKPENEREKKKLCVAFRVLCMLSSSHNIEPFILQTENIDYIFIFSMSFHKYNLKISQKIHSSFQKGDSEFNRMICGSKFDKEESEFIAGTRMLKFIPKYSYGNIFSSDFLSLLKPEDKGKYYRNMIARCMYLKKNAHLYWAKVAYPLYLKFLEENYKKPIFPKADIKLLSTYFPTLYSEKILNQPAIINQLSNMPKYEVAYRLGFPIHEYVPNEKKIEEELDILAELGVKKYVERMKEKEKRDNMKKDENVKFANTEDVNCSEIDEFNPFDVIHYYTDADNNNMRVFRFTRSEFPTLIKEQKNFYTGEVLPAYIVVQIRTRMQIAGMYDLPPPQTLSELLGLREDGNELSESSDVDDALEIEDQLLEDEQNERSSRNERNERSSRNERNNRSPPQIPRPRLSPPPLENLEDSDLEDGIEEVDEIDLDDIDPDHVIFKARNEDGDVLLFKIRLDDDLRDLDEEDLNDFLNESCLDRDLKFLRKFDCRCPECRDEIE